MHEVSLFRLYVLRAMYLFIVVGLGVYLAIPWPYVFAHYVKPHAERWR